MARQLRHWSSAPRACAYLPEREASLEYRLLVDVSPAELDHLLARGWRRFGPAYFRPRCRACSECVPLRIPVARFRPSRQQRRVQRRLGALRLEVGLPEVDDVRLDLHRRWQAVREARRGWSPEPMDAEAYRQSFAFPHPSIREYTLWDDAAASAGAPALVAVALVDETPSALSAVYTFHEPAHARLSPGTASILAQLEVAGALGKRWLYLGYRVLGCRSSEYKARFGPHELLQGWPALDEAPRWREVAPGAADGEEGEA